MSHEIRTPLNGVIGNVDLLVESELTKDQREQLEAIRVCGEFLHSLINDILDFSKIEAGRLELEQVAFAPVAMVNEVVSLFAQRAADKGLELHTEVPNGAVPHLLGDPTRLRQVLANLLSNAVKFTSEGSICAELRLRPSHHCTE